MKTVSPVGAASEQATLLLQAQAAVDRHPQALFSDFQWFLFEARDAVYFTAFSELSLDKDSLGNIVAEMVSRAPQLTHGFVGARPGQPFPKHMLDAITEVTLCRYKRKAFDHLIDEVPGFAKRLLAVASHELSAAQSQMLLLGRKAAPEKVASFLLMMADQHGKDGEAMIDIPMTRSDIGDYLGLTIETVSRTLTKLRQDGLIALPTPDRIKIRDRDQLEELAEGEAEAAL